MKNILFLLFLTLPLFAFTQNATKWQQKNSDKISNYVINKMNLNKKDAAFFSKVQLAQIVENANNIKESGASSWIKEIDDLGRIPEKELYKMISGD